MKCLSCRKKNLINKNLVFFSELLVLYTCMVENGVLFHSVNNLNESNYLEEEEEQADVCSKRRKTIRLKRNRILAFLETRTLVGCYNFIKRMNE